MQCAAINEPPRGPWHNTHTIQLLVLGSAFTGEQLQSIVDVLADLMRQPDIHWDVVISTRCQTCWQNVYNNVLLHLSAARWLCEQMYRN